MLIVPVTFWLTARLICPLRHPHLLTTMNSFLSLLAPTDSFVIVTSTLSCLSRYAGNITGAIISLWGYSFPFGDIHSPLGLFIPLWGYSLFFGAIHSPLGLFILPWGYSFHFWAIHSPLGLIILLWIY